MPAWNREDIAWIAGFFDGEGNIGCVRRKYVGLHVQIGQADPELLERIRDTLDFGKVYGPYRAGGSFTTRNGFKPKWLWMVQGFERVQAFAAMVWPWLSTRRRDQVRQTLAAFAEHKVLHPGPGYNRRAHIASTDSALPLGGKR